MSPAFQVNCWYVERSSSLRAVFWVSWVRSVPATTIVPSPLICSGGSANRVCVEGCRDDTECPDGNFCTAGLTTLIGNVSGARRTILTTAYRTKSATQTGFALSAVAVSIAQTPATSFCFAGNCLDSGDRDPLVNAFARGAQVHPAIAMSADGSFVVAWQSWFQDGYGSGVLARRYDPTGARLGSPFLVDDYPQGQ